MIPEPALANSTPLERDAHLVSTDHKVAPGEIAAGVVIGRASEYFDFFVYGIASVLVFPKVFFSFEPDALTATLYSFAVFALAFVARPIGSVIFMAVDRRHGRGVKLTIALFMLGGATAAVSFLPSYASIGYASIWLLAGLRILQGLALGGAWDGLASLLALNAPRERRGWFAMIPQLGAPLGFIVASALFSFFLVNLDSADFLDWGWRFPFYCAFTINVVALFARLRLVATDEFVRLMEKGKLEPVPVSEVVRHHALDVWIGAFVPLAAFALFHLVTIFPISWLTLFTDRSPGEFLIVQCSGAIVCAGAVAASGLIADQIGRRNALLLSSGLIAAFALGSIVAPLVFGDSAIGQTMYVTVGFMLMGLAYGQTAGAVTARLGARYRYTGAALTSDLAWLFGAGFAPLVVLWLSSRYGLWMVGLYLLSGAAASLLALTLDRSEMRQM
ncbi:Inner membrane metabolite transport protein YhjE [Methylobacterium cerastii]|uniref:Inner membrane metabolite transport protein YhjE n=1 Tax=Methylobacterium cerastii TaxID=932741 RepID=A0ABQ4QDF8_9HYPH|nr:MULTISPECIES: MFS transporter [Methylobacterium]TXM67426.1 MHS family MFS transporter [Methylobacterium sp. WL120]TXM75638.1 MHS family MFS transporter [Methylobacterium sp. WL12]TXN07451.1 MHS family MFS transporter [Methylobacterium sp. WL103]TXN80212.1 MHS family MFS transporter [Methylobacterium sp. WL8]GJD42865.1 Inner membrane metabolite transport protein YhjE [Methylobacterium cerastii]